MPGGRYRQDREPARFGPAARGPEGPRRRDPLRDVRGAGPLDRRAVGAGPRRAPRHPRQHRAPPPRAAARGRPGRRRGRPPGHGRAAPAPLLPRVPVRPGSGSTRPRTRCSPDCSPRSPNGWAPTPTRPPRPVGCGGATPAGGPGRAAASTRSRWSSPSSGSSRRSSRGGARGCGPHRVPALPVPRARRGLPGAGVQPPPGPLRGRGRRGRAGEQSRSSRRCTTPSRATSR